MEKGSRDIGLTIALCILAFGLGLWAMCCFGPASDIPRLEKYVEIAQAEVKYSKEEVQRYEDGVEVLEARHAVEIAALREVFAKGTLVKPTDQWLELYGDALASYQNYNLNIMVQDARSRNVNSPQVIPNTQNNSK